MGENSTPTENLSGEEVLYQGSLVLMVGNHEVSGTGAIKWITNAKPRTLFVLHSRDDNSRAYLGQLDGKKLRVALRVPVNGIDVELLAIIRGWTNSSGTEEINGSIGGPQILGDPGGKFIKADCSLFNFHVPSDGQSSREVLRIRTAEWEISLIALPFSKAKLQETKGGSGFAVTHELNIISSDGTPFELERFIDLTHSLNRVFSWCRGFRCSVALLRLTTESFVTVPVLGLPEVDEWKPTYSWLRGDKLNVLGDVLPPLIDIAGGSIGKHIRDAIYWYCCSNDPANGTDAGLILCHAALDLLAWTYLSKSLGWTKHQLDKEHASGRICKLLSDFGIPVGIPPELTGISGCGKDGPTAITHGRNVFVHPETKYPQPDSEQTSELWKLAHWYVDLILLKLAGYNGSYFSRLSLWDQWVPVPWKP